jgi:O-antigen/teichoic acid export membrane protein
MASLRSPERSRPAFRALLRRPGRSVVDNLGARLVALASVALVTVMVARTGGASDVGLLTLLRVLPGLAGVLAACGLPGAMGYFVAGEDRMDARLWPTIHVVMAFGAVLGTLVWMGLIPVLSGHLITASTGVLVVAGITVATQLPVAVGKACLQAQGDSRGSNIATAAEEAAFVPAFVGLWLVGARGGWLLVLSLLIADVVVAVGTWLRIRNRAAVAGAPRGGRPDRQLAVRMVRFGLRNQVGGVVGLLNLRLDFIVLGALAGPAPVGIYAVASKYAELLRLPALAVTWVAYPRVASGGTDGFATRARRAVPRLVMLGLAAGGVLALLAFPLLPLVYGSEFRSAVWPAAIIALGLVAEPAAGIGSAFLMGSGRPGLNSMLLTVGLLATVALDFLLIPRHGALGAAWASSAAYLLTDLLVIGAMWKVTRRGHEMGQPVTT